METKAFALDVEEIKAADGVGTFAGWLSVFGNEDLGHDVVEPGAFTKTLSERKSPVPILWQHNENEPIGVFRDLREDTQGGPTGQGGLRVKGELNLDTQRGKETYALLKQGALSGLSIGYGVVKDGFKGGTRLLKELRLHEGSVVVFPMNTAATVQAVKNEGEPNAAADLAEVTAAITRLSTAVEEAKALIDSIPAPEPDADAELVEALAGVKSLLTRQPATATGDAGADVEREALDLLRTMRSDVERQLAEV